MNIKIVQTPEEKQQAFSIRFAVFVEEQGVSKDIELDQHDATAIHFICYAEDQTPIAASRLRLVNKRGKLERICVLEKYRGLSIGTHLIQKMEKAIQTHNVHLATLHAQTHATSFYKQLGYETTSEPFMDAGIAHVAMEKQL